MSTTEGDNEPTIIETKAIEETTIKSPQPILTRPHPSAIPTIPKKKQVRIKILSAGDAGVGKSCLIKRYCEERFVPKYVTTIGVDYGVKNVTLSTDILSQDIQVHFWDLAGHPLFLDVRNEFYKHTQGIILVFSVMSRKSFMSLNGWLEEAIKYGAGDSVIAVCANKIDRANDNNNNNNNNNSKSEKEGEKEKEREKEKEKGKRVVAEHESRLWAESRQFLYFETSASSGEGVSDMFESLFSEVLARIQKK